MKIVASLLFAWAALAQQNVTFEGHPALEMANGKITLTINRTGGSMNRLVLNDDPEKLSPLWDPAGAARKLGQQRRGGTGGHFVCVDGFGLFASTASARSRPRSGPLASRGTVKPIASPCESSLRASPAIR